ncbi:MAG: sigma-54-dependent transcriptional response regulator [Magnetococcales bacterium]|nr:sigma-54-dependent transcriptional response regulator [Magnetococcales bacterium]HIJ84804.1 sigma-54-dependent Fis family transcriptional regulator [Magnetococcales bacterium]
MRGAGLKQPPIVLVDDEEEILFSSRTQLRLAGIEPVATIKDGRELLNFIETHGAAMVVLDLMMPHCTGEELLKQLQQRFPEIQIIIMTANQDIDRAVACIKEGASDYLVKPVENSRFIAAIRQLLEVRRLRQEVGTLKEALFSEHPTHNKAFADILTQSKAMLRVFQYVEAIAHSQEPVLVMGETGVGKELLVQAIHQSSGRSGALVSVNVAGLDDTMFSDTLFGHKKGAYSGATENRKGLISQAQGGSLFLDEIGDLKPTSQVKLLRLIQDRRYYPLGADLAQQTDARILCATHRDLNPLMKDNQFRPDLFFRLSSHQVTIPPLRERKEDLPLLTRFFLQEASENLKKPVPPLPHEMFNLLYAYDFPGNIRELRSMLHDALARHESGTLTLTSLKGATGHRATINPFEAPPQMTFHGRLPTIQEAEEFLITSALERTHGNKSLAASLLGITRQTLNNKLRKQEE